MKTAVTALLLVSCAAPQVLADEPATRPAADLKRGVIIPKVVTRHDPSQSYALYLPSNYDPAKRWPILYGFSPGARGLSPVQLFHKAAETYGWIVVGSNNSRNGPWEPIGKAIAAMTKDAEARFSIDERRRYATGFSGGARVAFYLAATSKPPFAGVIPVGAGTSRNQKPLEKETAPAVFAMCGVQDFNHAELLRLDDLLKRQGVAHRLLVFKGGHQWAPPGLCGAAVRYMELLWRLDHDPDRVGGIVAEEEKMADALLAAGGQYMRGHERFVELAELVKDTDAHKRLAARVAEIEASDTYKTEKAVFDELATVSRTVNAVADPNERFEKSVKAYMDFLKKHPKTEAGQRLSIRLQSTARATAMAAMQLVQRKDYKRAEVYLKRARIFSPTNNNVAYNLACVLARNGKKDEALTTLAEAVALGFTNLDHIMKDPDLESLRDDPAYKKIIEDLERAVPKTVDPIT